MDTVDRVSASNAFFYGHSGCFNIGRCRPHCTCTMYPLHSTYPAITSLRYELRVSESLPFKTSRVTGAGRVFAQVDTYIYQHNIQRSM
jgi:hypothetical protein